MSPSATVAGALVGALLVRQLLVLAAIVRSGRFLDRGFPAPLTDAPTAGEHPVFVLVVPVLREAAVLAEAVAHFDAVARTHAAGLVVVTTAREAAEAPRHPGSADTVALTERLATEYGFRHVHHPDPRALKADQLNLAAQVVADRLGDSSPSRVFLVCYDADSRPPLDSLAHFEKAITTVGGGVFHQSSRFALRRGTPRSGALGWPSRAVCDGGALRANRFVVGFELPRLLNRSAAVSQAKRTACSSVYTHVTTHGLCVRLSLLLNLPFPAGAAMEDMRYSFHLCSRGVPLVAVPSLDQAEVPDSVPAQVRQAARWFAGPARAASYLRDPATRPGWRARLLAVSALGSAAEWLGCALVPVAVVALVLWADGLVWWATVGLATTYAAQLAVTEALLGAPGPVRHRVVRLLACPVAAVLFGLGGFVGAVRLLTGVPVGGKTERRGPA